MVLRAPCSVEKPVSGQRVTRSQGPYGRPQNPCDSHGARTAVGWHRGRPCCPAWFFDRAVSNHSLAKGVQQWCMLLLLLGLWLCPCQAHGEELPRKSPVIRQTKEGLSFVLPPDWPIEERGGLLAPIPTEEYLGLKFDAVDRRLTAIEQRLGVLEGRLRQIEEKVK